MCQQNFHSGKQYPEGKAIFDHLTLEEMEKRSILNALRKTGANYTRAARLLGVTRRTLGYRVKKYGLDDTVSEIKDDTTNNDKG